MRRRLTNLISSLLMAVLALAPTAAGACTSFVLRNQDGSFVYGRTIEFGVPFPLKLALYPRNMAFKGTGPDGVSGSGLAWTGKYAFTGVDAFGLGLGDGMNEKGLTGGMLYLPVSSVYQDPTGDDAKNSIASYQVVNWAQSNFATVDEIKAGLTSVFVNNSKLAQWGGAIVKMHYTFHDMTGKSIVVEYLDGKLEITDNPIGVLTNEPPVKWQLLNVENYLNLSPFDRHATEIGGVTFAPRSAGSGLHGLPGDYMSQSRFLRAFEFSQAAQAYATNVPRVDLAWHLLNAFDIPPGSSMASDKKTAAGTYDWDFTQTSSVADPANLTYYVRGFGGMDVTSISFKDVDLNAAGVRFWDIATTSRFTPVR
jgi:choloylglycine hydrolase